MTTWCLADIIGWALFPGEIGASQGWPAANSMDPDGVWEFDRCVDYTASTDGDRIADIYDERYGSMSRGRQMAAQGTVRVIRSTFLVGLEGGIERAWYNVRADGHAAKVLEEIAG